MKIPKSRTGKGVLAVLAVMLIGMLLGYGAYRQFLHYGMDIVLAVGSSVEAPPEVLALAKAELEKVSGIKVGHPTGARKTWKNDGWTYVVEYRDTAMPRNISVTVSSEPLRVTETHIGAAEGKRRKPEEVQIPPTEQAAARTGVEKFLPVVVPDVKVSVVKINGKVHVMPIGLPHRQVRVDDTYEVLLSVDNSTVYGYMRLNATSERAAQGIPKGDIIPEEEAFKKAVPVLSFLKLPLTRQDFTARFNDGMFVNQDGTKEAFWDFGAEQQLNGIPCRRRNVLFKIAADNGELVSFRYNPIIVPAKALRKRVSRETAQKNAAEWVSKEPYLIRFNGVLAPEEGEGTLVIAPENNAFSFERAERNSEAEVKTFYCWEEKFAWVENGKRYEGRVWIDVQDGRFVGAG